MDAPFTTYGQALQARYGGKTYKLTLSGGQTCPTRDGTFGPRKGWGGCGLELRGARGAPGLLGSRT